MKKMSPHTRSSNATHAWCLLWNLPFIHLNSTRDTEMLTCSCLLNETCTTGMHKIWCGIIYKVCWASGEVSLWEIIVQLGKHQDKNDCWKITNGIVESFRDDDRTVPDRVTMMMNLSVCVWYSVSVTSIFSSATFLLTIIQTIMQRLGIRWYCISHPPSSTVIHCVHCTHCIIINMPQSMPTPLLLNRMKLTYFLSDTWVAGICIFGNSFRHVCMQIGTVYGDRHPNQCTFYLISIMFL